MRKKIKVFSLAISFIFVISCIFTVVPVVYAGEAQGKLVAHYKFDGNLTDSSGQNNNGTAIGSITFVDGVDGKGAKFDGKSYIEVKDSNSLDLDAAFTFSVWLYKDDIRPKRNQPVLSKLAGNDDEYSPYTLSDQDMLPFIRLVDEYTNYEGIYSRDIADIHYWYLQTVTFDGQSVKIYNNGALLENKQFANPLPHSSGKLYIGSDILDETSIFKGKMDDLRIYNYALTPSETNALYDNIAKGPGKDIVNKPQKLVAHYKLDGNLDDSSDSKLNGTYISPRGGITFVDAIDKKGAKFNGASYIEVSNSDWLQLDKEFTFSLWMFKEDNGKERSQPIISKLGSSLEKDLPSYVLYDYDNYLAVNLHDIDTNFSGIYSGNELDIQKWYFVTATYDGKNLKYYINGVLEDNNQFESLMPHSSGKLYIGSNIEPDASYFKGIMDDLRIYNYTLSASEVKVLYDSYMKKTIITLQLDNPLMNVNGKSMEVEPGKGTTPVLMDGRTMAPIQAIIEALGGTIGWVGEDNKVILQLGSTQMELWIDKNISVVNGVSKETDAAPIVLNESILFPLQLVAENLGCKFVWDENTNTITITYEP